MLVSLTFASFERMCADWAWEASDGNLIFWCFYDGIQWILTGAGQAFEAIEICLISCAKYILASRSSAVA
jgi:transposase